MNDTITYGCNLCGLAASAHVGDACPTNAFLATIPEVAPPDGEDGIESIIAQATEHRITVVKYEPTIQGYFKIDIAGGYDDVLNFLDLVGWGREFTTWTLDGQLLTCPENNE